MLLQMFPASNIYCLCLCLLFPQWNKFTCHFSFCFWGVPVFSWTQNKTIWHLSLWVMIYLWICSSGIFLLTQFFRHRKKKKITKVRPRDIWTLRMGWRSRWCPQPTNVLFIFNWQQLYTCVEYSVRFQWVPRVMVSLSLVCLLNCFHPLYG